MMRRNFKSGPLIPENSFLRLQISCHFFGGYPVYPLIELGFYSRRR